MSDRKRASDREMAPLSFRAGFDPEKDPFLVLSSAKLYMVTSESDISKALTMKGKLKVPFLPVSLPTSMESTRTRNDLLTQAPVTNVFSTICHLLGYHPNCENDGDWSKLPVEGMRDITCALTFLHVIMPGKVDPVGTFANVVPSVNRSNPKLLQFCINVPLSYGMGYSTHVIGCEQLTQCVVKDVPGFYPYFYQVGQAVWDRTCNSSFPQILGGPENCKTVQKSIFGRAPSSPLAIGSLDSSREENGEPFLEVVEEVRSPTLR